MHLDREVTDPMDSQITGRGVLDNWLPHSDNGDSEKDQGWSQLEKRESGKWEASRT